MKEMYVIVFEDGESLNIAEDDEGRVILTKKQADKEITSWSGPILSKLNPRIAKLAFIDQVRS